MTSGGQLVNDGTVEVSIEGHSEGARDGSGGHHKDMGRYGRLVPELATLFDTEAVLLVDDNKAEVTELDIVLDEGMGADEEVNLAFGKLLLYLFLGGGTQRAGKEFDPHPYSFEHTLEGVEMLSGEDFGRSHETSLTTIVDSQQHAHQSHQRLATAHITLHEAVHLAATAHILADFLHHAFLRSGEGEGQLLVESIETVTHMGKDTSLRAQGALLVGILIIKLKKE